VAEDEDLQVLGGIAAREQHEQSDGSAQRQVGEFGEHQGGLPVRVAGGVTIPSHGREHAAHRPRPTLRTLQGADDEKQVDVTDGASGIAAVGKVRA
jgi:hypothetical protein